MKRAFLAAVLAGLGTVLVQGGPATIQFEPKSVGDIREPVITSIRLQGTNIHVQARVPQGYARVILEACRRVLDEPWQPKAVARVEGAGGELSIGLSQAPGLEVFRLRADPKDALPGFFYEGRSAFDGQPSGQAGTVLDARGAPDGSMVLLGGNAPANGVDASAPRAVVESDIWKISGDTLYFFNQYRGLQVIDIRQPDVPVVLGQLPLSAAGEQMYLLDESHLVLLARDGCDWSSGGESLVMVVEVKNGQPALSATLAVPGTIAESRLVGSALYVASRLYRAVTNSPDGSAPTWEWGTQVTSFDLSTPGQPAKRSSEWISSSYNSAIAATDRFLFLADNQLDYNASPYVWRPVIHLIDISSPDGTMKLLSKLTPAGQVKDKFKLNLNGDVLTVVSEKWGGTTLVETFTLANPAAPGKLGSLKLIDNESLFATRFHGNLLYAVTFQRIDPLWVVDLSDPTQPKITGELQIPGVSTYLYPMDGRLVAIGWENTAGWQVKVSLFDVHDPAKPALLSRVAVGDTYSHSEANSDEKAFSVLPEIGLVLVPFSSWSTNGAFQGVQLIDLSRDSLALRGRIAHDVPARRATVYRDRVLSISGRELLSVDATDRDRPVVRASIPLSWPVDQVFLKGQYVLELDRAWRGDSTPLVRVAATADPNRWLGEMSLTNLPLLGATLQQDRLYVLHGKAAQVQWQWDSKNQTNLPLSTNLGVYALTILDLSRLPELTVAGQVQAPTADEFWGDWTAIWPKPDLLVWKTTGSYFMPMFRLPFLNGGVVDFRNDSPLVVRPAGGVAGPIISRGGFAPYYFAPWWGGPARFVAFDVKEAARPALVSDLPLALPPSSGGSGDAFTTNGLVYTSHREYEQVITGTNRYIYTNMVTEIVTNVIWVTNIQKVPRYTTVTNYETAGYQTNVLALNRPGGTDPWRWPGPAPRSGVLGAGGSHSLLLDPAGTSWAWGNNSAGQLGLGLYSPGGNLATPVPNITGAQWISAGYGHSLLVNSDGTVLAWGDNFNGQLGNGDPIWGPGDPPMPYLGSPAPVRVTGLSNITAAAAGFGHSLALDAEGRVYSWGADWSAWLDGGAVRTRAVPQLIAGLTEVRALAAGVDHSLAVGKDGTVWAWGNNRFGQLGNGRLEPASEPVLVEGIPGATAVAAGAGYSLALAADGSVWAWGNNEWAVLGTDLERIQPRPIPLKSLDRVLAVAAGPDHALALKSDGTVWAWGSGRYGELGLDRVSRQSLPAPVSGVSNALAVAAGRAFSLALTADGALLAWGADFEGQLGDGPRTTLVNEIQRTNVVQEVTYMVETNVTRKISRDYVTRPVVVTNEWPIVTYLEHHFLDVLDYAVPANPVARPSANLPGALVGISHDGNLLYTVAGRPATKDGSVYVQVLEVSAYDGIEAHLVDSLTFSNQWSLPVRVRDAAVFLARQNPASNPAAQLETWSLPASGKFTRLGAAPISGPVEDLVLLDGLLVARTGNQVKLFNVTDPAALKSAGGGGPDGCVYYRLDYADGSLHTGVLLPLGEYGVQRVPASSTPAAP
jgi:alpha-tubulin suppressor-like RCC1 family protein